MKSKDDLEIKADKISWFIALVIWVVGLVLIYFVWEWQKSIPGIVGESVAFITYIVAFFYFLALGPIKDWVFSHVTNSKNS